jgi:16S rRNA (uracil1498-N3)-methyltransferase
MRIPRIYTEQVLVADSPLKLEAGPSAHIARAMRMRVGDQLTLFNGRGGEFDACVNAVDKKTVTVDIGEHRDTEIESPLAIHLGIAISRGDRMDWVVQKATELGVQRVSPLITERTEVKLKSDRAEKKTQHWQQIAIAACEQCGRNTIPKIQPLQSLTSWVATTEADGKFVLHHRALAERTTGSKPSTIALLIGPEGGLSPVEISLAEDAGYQALRLGPRVMRTETAPLAAMAILQSQWGDMSPD